ncbi:hypothetical protein O987_12710 [Comamonas testosteroni TK102]|uniref:Uncharacterized protein n=1 Tax=Comamonas testosteroni TK102 TaxID=1392005 RepID=A0A076PSF2_COMTE|nr:hypothetical protein O987_12710 [Comamonas testosteroni TK102]
MMRLDNGIYLVIDFFQTKHRDNRRLLSFS